MERRLSLNQIAVPDDFPSDKFDAVSGKLGCHAYIRDALNAIAYRFPALAEYDERLRSLINAPDGQPFRYMQERDLFGFYSNAHSVFDAFCFALFAVGALIDPGNFPLASEADERNVTWSTMLRAYGKAFQKKSGMILKKAEKRRSCNHWLPEGSLSVLDGRHGAMNPAARVRCNMRPK